MILKNLTLAVLFLFFINCKNSDCITIEEKIEVNGNYYFLFSNETYNSNIEFDNNSGQVNFQTFQNYQVGDVYCDE